jgi:hypothetical protein
MTQHGFASRALFLYFEFFGTGLGEPLSICSSTPVSLQHQV